MALISKESLNRLMHDVLIATKHCSSAGLVSRKDGKIRGCTSTFKLEDFEIKAVSMAFKDVTLARGDPLVVSGTAYDCIRADGDSIYAKAGKTGLIVARTAHNFVIAHYDEGMHPSVCVEAVEKLADYFREKAQ